MVRVDTVVRYGKPYIRRARSTAEERHEHGTLAGFQAGCRCGRCRSARNRYDRVRRASRKVMAGREPVWRVNTGPARARIVQLRADGWSLRQIADKAGWSEMTVRRVMRKKVCWNVVADAIVRL